MVISPATYCTYRLLEKIAPDFPEITSRLFHIAPPVQPSHGHAYFLMLMLVRVCDPKRVPVFVSSSVVSRRRRSRARVNTFGKRSRSRIEQFLTLFNQAWVMEQKYILDLQEVPEGFEDIAEYLQRPLQEEEIRAKLRAEEEVEAMFAQQEAENEYYKRRAEDSKAREEEAKAREEEAKAREEMALEQMREARIKLARILLSTGMSVKDAALETGLSEDEMRVLE